MKTFLSLLLIITVLPLLSACVTPSQIMADAEVRRLCEKDGGIKVYETVKLPQERFEGDGSVYIPSKRLVKSNDKYYYERTTNYIKKGNPEMWRSHTKVYRQMDGKLLGETVSYARRGGDVPGPWHPSSLRCPNNAGLNDLNKLIFIRN